MCILPKYRYNEEELHNKHKKCLILQKFCLNFKHDNDFTILHLDIVILMLNYQNLF